MLQQSKLYKGLTIREKCIKVALFADDTVVYTNGNRSQFKVFLIFLLILVIELDADSI